jgi:pimeloyl-ACP methyl ester carboxylesterase
MPAADDHAAAASPHASWPNYREGDFVIRDYVFRGGQTLPELKLHYRTLGAAKRNTAGEIINGVLLLQGNTGTGANWLRPSLADELFAPGQPLDAAAYFVIMPDAIGRGGSSKPSDGLKGRFPRYRYHDMVESGYRLVTEGLGVAHLRLVIGSSMGGMHAWMWAEMYPDLMDGVVPISCQPVEISGRNWISRRAGAEAIRHDPEWKDGNYEKNPSHYIWPAAANSLRTESATRIQEIAPTRAAAADPGRSKDPRAFHPFLRRGVEAVSRRVHEDSRPPTRGRRPVGGLLDIRRYRHLARALSRASTYRAPAHPTLKTWVAGSSPATGGLSAHANGRATTVQVAQCVISIAENRGIRDPSGNNCNREECASYATTVSRGTTLGRGVIF